MSKVRDLLQGKKEQELAFPYNHLDETLINLRIIREACDGYGEKGKELVVMCDKMIDDTLRVQHLYGKGVRICDA